MFNLECLENRDTPSVTMLPGNVLLVRADYPGERITVNPAGQGAIVYEGFLSATVVSQKVDKLIIVGSEGNDYLVSNLKVQDEIFYGMGGNDRLISGISSKVTEYGDYGDGAYGYGLNQPGNDQLVARGKQNFVYGEQGYDAFIYDKRFTVSDKDSNDRP